MAVGAERALAVGSAILALVLEYDALIMQAPASMPRSAPCVCRHDEERLPSSRNASTPPAPAARSCTGAHAGAAWRAGDAGGDGLSGSTDSRNDEGPAHRAFVRFCSIYQLMRGPTNHWVSSSAIFTSPLIPQVGLNFTCAPSLP